MTFPPLHVITDDPVLAGASFEDAALAILERGGDRVALHLRGPHTSGARLFRHATVLCAAARASGARLLVNDRMDVARAAGAHGVHLGARSLDPGTVRRLWHDAWIGTSVHAADEARAAADAGTDFVVLGTIYPTASHPGRRGAGTSLIAASVAAMRAPVVAIGGLTAERAAEVAAAGASGIAVLGAVWNAADPAAAVSALLEAWARTGKGS